MKPFEIDCMSNNFKISGDESRVIDSTICKYEKLRKECFIHWFPFVQKETKDFYTSKEQLR